MIDLKYHIASLVAIFCALAIGVFIGSNLVGNEVLVEQQKEVVARLEQEFDTLREQNKLIQEELNALEYRAEEYRRYSEQVFPLVVSGRLNGVRIAVIETNSQGLAEKVEKALITAGADVVNVIIIDWNSVPDLKKLLAKYTDEYQEAKDNDIRTATAKMLGEALAEGKNKEFLHELVNSGFIKIKGEGLGQKVEGIVFIEGDEKERNAVVDSFNLPLLEYYLSLGSKVVIGEYEEAKFSYLDKYKAKPVTTVDNIDNPIGLTSMVFAFSGKIGNYGTGKTAEKLIPEIE
ncbi:MAG: copper transporter [Clostridia bacterium]|nr:copper transporter [Clostridia bacterium]